MLVPAKTGRVRTRRPTQRGLLGRGLRGQLTKYFADDADHGRRNIEYRCRPGDPAGIEVRKRLVGK
jgi:hypothetical protein